MSKKPSHSSDPFRKARKHSAVMPCEFQNETLPMILRHADVRKAARDWQTYSSDAPFKVPIPSEENVRSMRQLPVETNPPEHTAYLKIVEPFFQRAKETEMIQQVRGLIEAMVDQAFQCDQIEIVREFALPIQSHSLSYLLNVPESEADRWISWGTHVFRDGGDGEKKGAALESYLHDKFDEAEKIGTGEDFFSALCQATFQGRPLNREEMMGFANLTFAGGRDTIINSIATVVHYLGENPSALQYLREDVSRIPLASEELFRVLTPLTHTARVCPVDTDVHGYSVPKDGRVSLCWASANYDEEVFDAPEEVRLDRKPNPHLAFGFGPHLCLGAAHARLVVRTLLDVCVRKVDSIHIIDSIENIEKEQRYHRAVGFDCLNVHWNSQVSKSPSQ